MSDSQNSAFDAMNNIQSMRGKYVFDADNTKVGTVSAVDAQTGYFVTQKGLFSHDLYIPLSAVVRSNSTAVALNLTKEMLKDPLYTTPATTGLVGTTGVVGAAGAAPTTDAAPTTGTTPSGTANVTAPIDTSVDRARPITQPGKAPVSVSRTEIDDVIVPIREETLLANKVAEKIGNVHVHRYVVEEQQTIMAPITHEEISIEHIVVTNQPTGPDAFTEKDLNMPVMGERLIVGKETHVVEEVHIYKHQVTEQQQASGTLRKEQLKVEGDVQLGDDARDARPQDDIAEQGRTLSDQSSLS